MSPSIGAGSQRWLLPLLSTLRKAEGQHYVLLDASASPGVLAALKGARARYESLFNGVTATELADVAPYLVQLEAGGILQERLLAEGWGHGWGVYLQSPVPLELLRSHFRRFPLVHDPEGREFYFRFYDPRVLRAFLPACSVQECEQFFGPVTAFCVEGREPGEMLKITRRGRAVVETIRL